MDVTYDAGPERFRAPARRRPGSPGQGGATEEYRYGDIASQLERVARLTVDGARP